MKRLFAAVLILTACSTPAAVTTTASPTETKPPLTTTSTTVHQPVEIRGCESPPVTFSPLCEVFELLDDWYVDTIDSAELAGVALRGLKVFTTTETEEPPRTLFCAIPHESFAAFCEELATQVETSQIPVGDAVEAAVAHMIDVGLDPFTYYLPPEQVGTVRQNGIVGGVGLLLDARDAAGSKCSEVNATCRLEVIVVLEENPGFDAGLRGGDIIVAIDGRPAEGRGFTEIVSTIAGDETGTVVLEIDRDGVMSELTIERAELNVPTIEFGTPVEGVGYLRIPDFEADIPRLVEESLVEILADDPTTLVVDLRDNPGGLVRAVVEIADDFVDGGIVMVSEAPSEYLEYPARPGGLATSQRLVVLVNNGTASAAEVLAGALRDRRGAVIVGSSTFGKDAVQIPFTLRNGGEFHVAVARWSTPDGATAGRGGLTPDSEVAWPAGATVEEVIALALEAAS